MLKWLPGGSRAVIADLQMKIAQTQWNKVEQEAGEELLLNSGFLIVGPENEEFKRYEATATKDV